MCSTGGGGGCRTWDQELEVEEEMEEVLVEDSSPRTSSKGATAGEMESMMDLKSPESSDGKRSFQHHKLVTATAAAMKNS